MLNRRTLVAAGVATALFGKARGGLLSFVAASAGTVSGQLAAGHWIPAKMSMTAVHPRPDAATSSASYHRNAHASVQYMCPVEVQGGAYPLWYEIISAPAGATCGAYYNSTDYGVVRWTPTSGTQTFTIRVHDQDANTIDVTWTVAVGTSWVKFCDSVSGNDTTGDGSFATPWATYSKANTAVTTGICVCLKAGAYSTPTSSISLSGTTHRALFAVPNATVTMDCSPCTNNGATWYINTADWYAGGIAHNGSPNVDNPRYYYDANGYSRGGQFRCSFDSPTDGSAGGTTDNEACLFLGAGGAQRQYVFQTECTFSHLPSTGTNGFASVVTYKTDYFLHGRNTYGTPSTTAGSAMRVKGGDSSYVSIRHNRFTAAWNAAQCFDIFLGKDGGATNPPDHVEICFNTIVDTNTTTYDSNALQFFSQFISNAGRSNLWSYRNTVKGNFALRVLDTGNVMTTENEVIVNDITSTFEGTWTYGRVLAFSTNDPSTRWHDPSAYSSYFNLAGSSTAAGSGCECHGLTSAGIIDSSFLLTGAYRTSYLGTRGAEIA